MRSKLLFLTLIGLGQGPAQSPRVLIIEQVNFIQEQPDSIYFEVHPEGWMDAPRHSIQATALHDSSPALVTTVDLSGSDELRLYFNSYGHLRISDITSDTILIDQWPVYPECEWYGTRETVTYIHLDEETLYDFDKFDRTSNTSVRRSEDCIELDSLSIDINGHPFVCALEKEEFTTEVLSRNGNKRKWLLGKKRPFGFERRKFRIYQTGTIHLKDGP